MPALNSLDCGERVLGTRPAVAGGHRQKRHRESRASAVQRLALALALAHRHSWEMTHTSLGATRTAEIGTAHKDKDSIEARDQGAATRGKDAGVASLESSFGGFNVSAPHNTGAKPRGRGPGRQHPPTTRTSK
jgi:hypothetical protein